MNVRFQRVRNVAGIVALAAVATAASLGVAEFAVRAFNVGPRILVLNHGNYRLSGDLILRYELAPGSPDGDTVISSGGLRDREFSVAKPPRTFRIACIGDSITYGFGLAAADSYPKQLEKLLNAYCADSSLRFEVMNFGVPGYNLREIAENLKVKVLKYDPDLVIYGYCLNDPQDVSLEFLKLLPYLTDAGKKFVCPPATDGFWATHSRLWRLAVYAVRRSTTQGRTVRFSRVNAQADPENLAMRESADVSYFKMLHAEPEGRRNLDDALDAMAAACAAKRVPVCVFVFPVMKDLDSYPLTDVHRQVAELCRARSFHAYDLEESMRTYQHRLHSQEYLDELHPAAPTDHYVAMAMLSMLLQDSMLPRITPAEAMRRLRGGAEEDQRLGRLAHFLPAS